MSNDIAVVAPKPQLLAGTNGLIIAAPAPTLVSASSVVTLSIVLVAPAPRLSSSGLNGGALDFLGAVPAARLSSILLSENLITIAAVVLPPTLVTSLLPGNSASVSVAVPKPTILTAGYPAYILTFAGRAAAPQLISVLTPPVSANWRTWVMNTRKGGLTEYSGFSFNSYALFNGVVLACGSTGVVVLDTSSLDGSTNIDATVTTGAEGFSSSFLKRVPRIYVGHRTDGDLHFSTITAEGGTRVYALPFNGSTDIQQRRVGVGKGPKSRYWQFTLTNVAGSDFSIEDIIVYPTHLRRRIQ